MIDDHHGRAAGRATLLVRAVDGILAPTRVEKARARNRCGKYGAAPAGSALLMRVLVWPENANESASRSAPCVITVMRFVAESDADAGGGLPGATAASRGVLAIWHRRSAPDRDIFQQPHGAGRGRWCRFRRVRADCPATGPAYLPTAPDGVQPIASLDLGGPAARGGVEFLPGGSTIRREPGGLSR